MNRRMNNSNRLQKRNINRRRPTRRNNPVGAASQRNLHPRRTQPQQGGNVPPVRRPGGNVPPVRGGSNVPPVRRPGGNVPPVRRPGGNVPPIKDKGKNWKGVMGRNNNEQSAQPSNKFIKPRPDVNRTDRKVTRAPYRKAIENIKKEGKPKLTDEQIMKQVAKATGLSSEELSVKLKEREERRNKRIDNIPAEIKNREENQHRGGIQNLRDNRRQRPRARIKPQRKDNLKSSLGAYGDVINYNKGKE